MAEALRTRLLSELDRLRLIDPHSHIDPHAPAAETLADILGYHYYTELAHSAGMSKAEIEEPGIDPRQRVRRLVAHLEPLENTIQYRWLMEMLRELFDFHEPQLTSENWEAAYEACEDRMSRPDWPAQVLESSRLEAVFLTNNFDDPLEGFDTDTYIPCLRTDELVFHLSEVGVRERLEQASATSVHNAATLRQAIGKFADEFSRGVYRRARVRFHGLNIARNLTKRK